MYSKSDCEIHPQKSFWIRGKVMYGIQHLNHVAKIVKRIEIMVSQEKKVVSLLNFFFPWVRTQSVPPITEPTTFWHSYP